MLRLGVVFALLLPAFAHAGVADGVVEWSRDEHYVYVKTPMPLTMDAEQVQLIKDGIHRAEGRIKELFSINPRVGKADASIQEAANSSLIFGTSLDTTINFLQKNYGTIASTGWHRWNLTPSAVVLYGGIAMSGTRFLTIGGAGTIGVVAMIKKVYRTKIDTGETDDYMEPSANLFVWGSAFFGPPGVTGKKAFPLGFGLVFGTLAKPEDFNGITGTVNLYSKNQLFAETSRFAALNPLLSKMIWKISFIKNINKSGWPSNVMLSGSYLFGDADAINDPFASLSYIGDLQTWVHNGLDLLQGAEQKLFGVNPPVQVEKLPGSQH